MKGVLAGLVTVAVIGALILASRYSYLLFHGVAETFSIVILASVFMISWASRSYPEARPFVILGIGFLFVAVIDVFHTLSYEGMDVLPSGWIIPHGCGSPPRGPEGSPSSHSPCLLRLRRRSFSAAFRALYGGHRRAVGHHFSLERFPICFMNDTGLTTFKKASEYGISSFSAAAILLVMRMTIAAGAPPGDGESARSN